MLGAVYAPLVDLEVEAWVTDEPVPFDQRTSGRSIAPTPGAHWGDLWDCAWFHVTGVLPESADGQRVVVLVDLGGEACLVDDAGEPVLGLTPAATHFDAKFGGAAKRVIPFAESARGGKSVDLWIEAGSYDLFGDIPDVGRFHLACFAIEREDILDLFHDFSVTLDLATTLPRDTARRAQAIAALTKASQRLGRRTRADVAAARQELAPVLAKRNADPSLAVSAMGQAHLDLAWLWPIRETVRKGGRTFATALAMMDRYPDYVFGASQPQLYAWIKERYPALYSRVKQRIAEGRWEPQGGMWVEADVNLPSGESLVRQLLYGTRFFHDEFGHTAKVAWLPDNFGFPASLPQVLKQSGLEYFQTIKLSWNRTNAFPRHSFWWRGIDGTAVLAHMPPEGTYNSAALPSSLCQIEEKYRDKDVSGLAMLLYGIGDGGGGPGTEHLERLTRLADLEGLPPVKQETSEAFFQRLEDESDDFRTWDGDLYLEYHQGTFTSQSRTKRYNRKLEVALHDAEIISILAMIECASGFEYPRVRLEAIWKEALLYQFHDILAGSSITRVYDESHARYDALQQEVEALIVEAAAWLGATPWEETGTSSSLLVFNTLPWERSGWVCSEKNWAYVRQQDCVHSMGLAFVNPQPPLVSVGVSSSGIENEHLRARFDECGHLVSLTEKSSGREAIAGPANVLSGYFDDGNAWDFPPGYRDGHHAEARLVSQASLIDGPRAVLRQRYQLGNSTIEQDVVLLSESRRLEFITRVDWRETHTMLRTAFPVDVYSREAVADIQFGTFRRATHRNTSWDEARDEFCAHKWVDLSQPDFGVALLNDCKYGHSVRGNVIDLNLLRSPTSPDPLADQGVHQFTYAVYPHAGDHIVGDVPQQAYDLNFPLRAFAAPERPDWGGGLVNVVGSGIMVETIKPAEDSDAVVLRCFEWTGGTSTVFLHFGWSISEVWCTDLLENHISRIDADNSQFDLTLAPFEIATLKLVPKAVGP
jgi:alpha-mannosidase